MAIHGCCLQLHSTTANFGNGFLVTGFYAELSSLQKVACCSSLAFLLWLSQLFVGVTPPVFPAVDAPDLLLLLGISFFAVRLLLNGNGLGPITLQFCCLSMGTQQDIHIFQVMRTLHISCHIMERNRKIGYCPRTLPAGILQYYGNPTGKLDTAPGPCLQESCSIMGMQQENWILPQDPACRNPAVLWECNRKVPKSLAIYIYALITTRFPVVNWL